MTPQRIQLCRTAGFRLQEASRTLNGLPALKVVRPGKYGNPFKVGHVYIMGDPDPRRAGPLAMTYCERLVPDPRGTTIADVAAAVEWFRRLCVKSPPDLKPLIGFNLACWCPLGKPCHADVLLELIAADRQKETR